MLPYDCGSVRETALVYAWVRSHADKDAGDFPAIADVPRAHCQNHCAAWNKRRVGSDYCGRTITTTDKRCARSWGWFRERVGL